jgi:hypothetical protein
VSTFVTGNSGRFQNNGVIIAGIRSFKITKKTAVILFPHYEMDADGDNNLWPSNEIGYSEADVTGEGWFDVEQQTATDSGGPGLFNGASVLLDLILARGLPWGFFSLPVTLSQYEVTSNIENVGTSFTFAGKINGIAVKSGV